MHPIPFSQSPSFYKAPTTFTISGVQTNYDVGANIAGLFDKWPFNYIRLKTDNTIQVKLNTTANDSIERTSSDSGLFHPFVASNIYITTTGSTDITLVLARISS